MEYPANYEIQDKPPTDRLIAGSIILITGFLSPLLIPLIVSSGLSAGNITVISGLLAFGIPELFMLLAVAVLGKSGYSYLKERFFNFLKRYAPPDEVSQFRHRAGVILFLLPITVGVILPYLEVIFPVLKSIQLWFIIPGDIMLLTSLFILGGNFWDKLRALFIRKTKVVLDN